MKIGIIIETLRQSFREGVRTAADLGVEGIQFYATNAELDFRTASVEDVRKAYAYIRECGLAVSSITGDLPGHGYSRPDEVPARVEAMKRMIDLALEMECTAITNHIGVVPSDPADPEYPVMVDSLGQVASYAAAKGAALAVETGPEPAATLKRLIDDVASPGLAVNLDPANLKMVQNQDAEEAVRILAGHIVHTHAKDGVFFKACNAKELYDSFAEGGYEALVARTGKLFEEVPLGEGQVNWDAYLTALDGIGYKGFLTIEREAGANPVEDISQGVLFLRKKLKELSL